MIEGAVAISPRGALMRRLIVGMLGLAVVAFSAPSAHAAAPPASPSIGGVPTLIQDLKSRDIKARRQAAQFLGLRGPRAIAALPALIAAFADADLEVRVRAAAAAGKIGEPALKDLLAALENEDTHLRRGAI